MGEDEDLLFVVLRVFSSRVAGEWTLPFLASLKGGLTTSNIGLTSRILQNNIPCAAPHNDTSWVLSQTGILIGSFAYQPMRSHHADGLINTTNSLQERFKTGDQNAI